MLTDAQFPTYDLFSSAALAKPYALYTGSVIALDLGAANHDLAKFTNPDQFDITRCPNEHLGFAPGVHFCLGVVLARMELAICFATLLKRMPNLQFDSSRTAIPRRTSLTFKGFESLDHLQNQ